MKKYLFLIFILTTVNVVFAQTIPDSVAVLNAAVYEGYVGAFLSANGPAMQKSLHPMLIKQKVTSQSSVSMSTVEGLVTNTANRTPMSFESAELQCKLLDITGNVAAVWISNIMFWDMVFLTKYDTTWLVTNVAWDNHSVPENSSEEEVTEAVRNFISCLHTGNDTILDATLHRMVDIRRPISGTEVERVKKNWLIEQCQNKRWLQLNGNPLDIQVDVLCLHRSYASVKVTSNWGTEFYHLRYFEPQWMVVNGIWERSATEVSDIDSKKSAMPVDFKLGQNYPNPFNPATAIPFSLNQSEKVNLTVYDLQGRAVKTLLNGIENTGNHEAVWDALDDDGILCCSGTYFYKFTTPNFSKTRKMILLR